NKLLEFDDYSDLGKNYDLRTLYSGGYPLCFSNEHNGYIYESNNTKCTKFQSHVFDSSSAGPYASTSEIIKYFKSNITSLVGVADLIWTADGVKDNKGVQYAPYWKYLNLNPWLKYGGGSSGSLALRASDPLDPDTYIASGINCSEGIVPGSNNNAWISFQNFVPFAFNFGKNLPEDVDWHIMHKFYNSDAFEKWKPVNDCMYAFD
ncbi:MAG: hypothetical protein HUJ52_03975, partial [Malacoplasma sp.]|nr:hypothetical protein [Malacoplasma sp.]